MTQTTATRDHTRADVLYEGLYSAGVGGSVVALFFLIIDAFAAQPLYTPSLMGSVMFQGAQAANVTEVSLAMVAYFTVVHFATFGVLGLAAALLVHEIELHSRHPGELLLLFFVVFECGFFMAAYVLLPGVVEVVGAGRLFVVNLIAAGSMALVFLANHREGGLKGMLRELLGAPD